MGPPMGANVTRDRDSDMDLLAAALAYARHGWAVFPLHTWMGTQCSCGRPDCPNPGKHPRTKNGLKDATTDESTAGSR